MPTGREIPKFQPGKLTKEDLDRLVDGLNQILNLRFSGAVKGETFSNAGAVMHVDECTEFIPIRLSGGGTDGKYSWVEVEPIKEVPFWQDLTGGRSGDAGTRPAIEDNGNANIAMEAPGPFVFARILAGERTPRFQLGQC